MNKLVITLAAVGLSAVSLAPAAYAAIPTLQHSDFEAGDRDNSSTLTFGELLGAAPAVTQELFASADVNGDGVLSLSEFLSLHPAPDDTQPIQPSV